MTFQPLKKDSVLGTYYIQKYDAADEEDSHKKILYYDDVRSAVEGLKEEAVNAPEQGYVRAYINNLFNKWFPVFSHLGGASSDEAMRGEAVSPKTGSSSKRAPSAVNPDVAQSPSSCDLKDMRGGGSELDEHFFSRVEVITDKGREYVSWSNHKASIQDNGRTLKIFKQSLSQPSLAQPQKVPASSEETNRSQRGDAGELKTQKKSEGGLPKGYKDEKHVARKGCSCKHGSGKITLALVEKENLCGCSCHKDTHNGDSPSTIKGIPKESDER